MVYDAAGSLVGDEGGRVYEYDHDNRVVRVWRGVPVDLAGEYVYDALGRRIARTLVLPGGGQEATVYCCDGQNVLAEYDDEGGLARYFVNGPQYIDERVLVHEAAGGAERYYLLRELYTVAGLADASGAMTTGYRYNAYGQPTGVTSDNPYYFTGRSLDVIPGASPGSPVLLYDYRARTYDPVHGRFLQRDPAGYADGMNLYQYVEQNPLNTTDPTGLCGSCCFDSKHRFSRVCVTVGAPKGRCKGTAKIGDKEFPVDIDLSTFKEITKDCDGCSKKCLPFPVPVIFPVETEIDYEGTQTVWKFEIKYSTELKCKLTGGWLVLWTCCRHAAS